jgi:phage terminase large subunit-like protein
MIEGRYYVEDIRRARTSPQGVEQLILQTAELDGKSVSIYMEQEPGASGKALIDHYARHVLVGFTFRPDKVTGNKGTDYLDELEAFPLGSHDDQVDATSGAFSMLNTHAGGFVIKLHR